MKVYRCNFPIFHESKLRQDKEMNGIAEKKQEQMRISRFWLT